MRHWTRPNALRVLHVPCGSRPGACCTIGERARPPAHGKCGAGRRGRRAIPNPDGRILRAFASGACFSSHRPHMAHCTRQRRGGPPGHVPWGALQVTARMWQMRRGTKDLTGLREGRRLQPPLALQSCGRCKFERRHWTRPNGLRVLRVPCGSRPATCGTNGERARPPAHGNCGAG